MLAPILDSLAREYAGRVKLVKVNMDDAPENDNMIKQTMNTINEIETRSFNQEVLQAPTPVLVDFYAPWCGPCKMLAPILDSLAREYAGRVKLVKVNMDDAPELAQEYQITGVPTLMLFQDGQVEETLVGLATARALRALLDRVSVPAAEPPPEPAPRFG
jgi:thioredoxin 1